MENQGFIILNGAVVGRFDDYGKKVIFSFGYSKDEVESPAHFFSEIDFFSAKLVFLCDLTLEECEEYSQRYEEAFS